MGHAIVKRTAARTILVVLAAPAVAIGVWADVAPGSFFRTFPGDGWHWLTLLGPYNEHMVRDFGGLNLSLAVLTLSAAVALTRRLLVTTAIAWEVYSIPHLAFHLLHSVPIPVIQTSVNVVGLVGAVLGPPAALLLGAGAHFKDPHKDPVHGKDAM